MTVEMMLGLSLAVPVVGAALILLLRRNPNAREAASLVTAGALFAIVLRIYAGGERAAPVHRSDPRRADCRGSGSRWRRSRSGCSSR